MKNSQYLVELIERIGNLLRLEERELGKADGLQPVHVQVLEYLALCNRFSNTPLSLSRYLGISKGTISQSVIVLENKGLIEKAQDKTDRRVVHLMLTNNGKRVVKSAFANEQWSNTCERLPAQQRERMAEDLAQLLTELTRQHSAQSFGVCRTCQHFNYDNSNYSCRLLQIPLEACETAKLCHEHSLLEDKTEASATANTKSHTAP
ncbi:MAG: winged helix-turn-helix transcriptional regulator [Thiotrichales bacterium]|nr:winged helix-turn-helix transcriptional regulator [Thiotrichales bacterium]